MSCSPSFFSCLRKTPKTWETASNVYNVRLPTLGCLFNAILQVFSFRVRPPCRPACVRSDVIGLCLNPHQILTDTLEEQELALCTLHITAEDAGSVNGSRLAARRKTVARIQIQLQTWVACLFLCLFEYLCCFLQKRIQIWWRKTAFNPCKLQSYH